MNKRLDNRQFAEQTLKRLMAEIAQQWKGDADGLQFATDAALYAVQVVSGLTVISVADGEKADDVLNKFFIAVDFLERPGVYRFGES